MLALSDCRIYLIIRNIWLAAQPQEVALAACDDDWGGTEPAGQH